MSNGNDRSDRKGFPRYHVRVRLDGETLDGEWCVPASAVGLVLFAHGNGSSRHSPNSRAVANVLQEAGIGTLLLDLLTPAEERVDAQTGHLRVDITLLARRLLAVTRWATHRPDGEHLALGYFGTGTGGAAALVAASQLGPGIGSVVSCGGHPDLARDFLTAVKAPTLLIVGGRDEEIFASNQGALQKLQCTKILTVVPEATQQFEEPGAIEQVARFSAAWFQTHLRAP